MNYRRIILSQLALVTLSSLAVASPLFEQELFIEVPEEVPFSESTAPAAGKNYNPDYSKTVEANAKVIGSVTSPSSTVTGSLDGKIVYLMAGHGWSYDSPGVWSTQRFEFNNMVEDFGNLDQATIMADMLLNAGATVVPLRPFGIQDKEVVIDNDDPTVTFSGTWSNSGSTNFYGTAGDVAYRFASISAGSTTATAEYDASTLIPADDYYPVYAWTRVGTDRIDQEYIIAHSGGTTSRRVHHQRVGSGWVYLGTYHFEQNGSASVTITNNRSSGSGGVVIADAIRFGNGMGDASVEGDASGHPRHEENGRYWLAESRGEGSGLTTSGSVSSPPRLAAYMNYEGGSESGTNTDRVYLSFHSNGGGGRGADGLFNNNPGDSTSDPLTANGFNTPNGVDFAIELGTRVNTDMTIVTNAAGNPFENTWGQSGAGTNIFGSGGAGFSAYGEINNTYLGTEMAATIIEVAFHDSAFDAELMRDPKGREAMARANVHGVINYFNDKSGSPSTLPPERPTEVFVESDASGNLTLNWTPPVAGGQFGAGGDAPTGYLIEVSTNGKGFEPVTTVAGGSTSSASVSAFVPNAEDRYFRVVAQNAGGISFPSNVVGARKSTAKAPILIVNGFDRYDRTLNRTRTEPAYLGSSSAGGGTFDRVIPKFNNRFDYIVDLGIAIDANNLAFDSCMNENIISGDISLTDYDAVFWILGAESTADSAFDATEQTLVTNYLNANGNLFLSGSEAAWDLGRTTASAANKTFLEQTLRVAQFTSGNPQDSSGTYQAQGTAATPFSTVGSLTYSDGSDIHGDFDVAFPDVLNPINGSFKIMDYTGSGSGSAGIAFDGNTTGDGRVVYLGFPLEVVLDQQDKLDVVSATISFFGTSSRVNDYYMFF